MGERRAPDVFWRPSPRRFRKRLSEAFPRSLGVDSGESERLQSKTLEIAKISKFWDQRAVRQPKIWTDLIILNGGQTDRFFWIGVNRTLFFSFFFFIGRMETTMSFQVRIGFFFQERSHLLACTHEPSFLKENGKWFRLHNWKTRFRPVSHQSAGSWLLDAIRRLLDGY